MKRYFTPAICAPWFSLRSLAASTLLLPVVAQAQPAIESVLMEACVRLEQSDQSNLTSGQLLLRDRCVALQNIRQDQGEAAYQTVLENVSPEQMASQQRNSRSGAKIQSRNVNQRMGRLRATKRTPLKSLGFYQYADGFSVDIGGLDIPRWGAFVNGSLDSSSKDATDREPSYDSDATGVTLGTDYRINTHWVAGIALGQSEARTDFVSREGAISSDSMSAIIYGSYSDGGWVVDLSLGKTTTDSETARKIDYYESTQQSDRVQARPSGDTGSEDTSFSLNTEYQFQNGGWTYGPYLMLEAIESEADAFSESQAEGWGIGYAPQSNRLTRYEGGVRATWVWNQSWGVLTPGAHLGGSRYQQSELEPVVARLLFDELQTRTFEMKPDQLDQNYQTLGLDCAAVMPGGFSWFAAYEQYLGYENLDIATVTVGVRAEL